MQILRVKEILGRIMKALILTDLSDKEHGFKENFEQLVNLLKNSNYKVEVFYTKQNRVESCVACYSCWIRTPGICRIKDSIKELSKWFYEADLFILYSRIEFGCYSSEIKCCLERMIPNMLPFFENRKSRMYHSPRYDKYPFYVMVGYGEYIAENEKECFTKLANANAINMQKTKCNVITIQANEKVDFNAFY